jgi:isopenicillin N synthase-like dioxygenase
MSFSSIFVATALMIGTLCSPTFGQSETLNFEPTIPVLDMNEFRNPETKLLFVEKLSKAMHEVGFFAVINPQVDEQVLYNAYDASKAFFCCDDEKKTEIFDPALSGQRGYVPSEIPQGGMKKDLKEFLHIGRNKNLWPSWMNLKTPMEQLIETLDKASNDLQRAFALSMGEDEEYFIQLTESGECLLRALHYPAGPVPGTVWAGEHTDIDFFTILPMATEEGLEVFHQDKWIPVKVPSNAFIVNCGDKLQNLTNGYFKSSFHRVEAKPETERYSIVYFVHPRDEDLMSPTKIAIEMTGGVQRYPDATSLELLTSRLRELGLATPELLQLEKDSGIMGRIEKLVEKGVAADPVVKTYSIWKKSHKD